MWLTFLAIGVFGGVMAGFFGVGGGIVIVPALIYLAGFSQHQATGTSLAVLLPPLASVLLSSTTATETSTSKRRLFSRSPCFSGRGPAHLRPTKSPARICG